MTKADTLLNELVDGVANYYDPKYPWPPRVRAAWSAARAYLNEKPHEPMLYPNLEQPDTRRDASPPHAAAEPEKPMNDDLPGMLAVARGVAEQKWPHTMDAAVWAREWIARTKDHPDVATDEGAMIGWFANAIMAGHDTAQARGGSYKEGWKDCVKAHDGLHPPHAEFQSPAAETPLYASPSAQPIARERQFPMQNGPSIPWSLAEIIYAGYSECYGSDQSLERLAERGGFGWAEVERMWKIAPRFRDALKSAGKE